MKQSIFGFLLLASSFCFSQNNFTGSTPANRFVRDFLGITTTDSIDFIRWKLRLGEGNYSLNCTYGMSKANTNGFVNGGGSVNFEGSLLRRKDDFIIQQGSKQLRFSALDNNLLHISDSDGSLLVGNDGWNYTLSRETPLKNPHAFFPNRMLSIRDSARFVGRTPCLPPGTIRQSPNCYKLKWTLVLYAKSANEESGRFRIRASVNQHQPQYGSYTFINTKNAGSIYQLQIDGQQFYLKVLDANVLAFVNQEGELLVGNEDFSFTLNRAL